MEAVPRLVSDLEDGTDAELEHCSTLLSWLDEAAWKHKFHVTPAGIRSHNILSEFLRLWLHIKRWAHILDRGSLATQDAIGTFKNFKRMEVFWMA